MLPQLEHHRCTDVVGQIAGDNKLLHTLLSRQLAEVYIQDVRLDQVQSRVGELLTQVGDQIAIDLDSHQMIQVSQEWTRQRPASWTDLDDGSLTSIRRSQVRNESQGLLINEKVLSETFAGTRQRAGTPGR